MTPSPNTVIDQVLPKPKFGKPCNSCGACCLIEPCGLAKEFFGDTSGPCKALESDGDKRVCGLVIRPAWYLFKEEVSEAETGRISCLLATALGLGMGCDSDD